MKAKCIICRKEFERYDSPRKGGHNKLKRPYKSLTCSGSCSKVYTDISRHLRCLERHKKVRKCIFSRDEIKILKKIVKRESK